MPERRNTVARDSGESQTGDRERYRRRLAAILAAGLLLRCLVLVAIPTQPVSDFFGFLRVAQNLAESGRYVAKPGISDGGRSPAYPILLSLAIRLAPTGGDLAAAKGVNLALTLLAGLAGATLSRRLWGDAAGLWTAVGLALLPRSVLMADLLAAENLLAPLLLAFLLFAAVSWTRGSSRRVDAAIGLAVGLMCLTRSVTYFFPAVWLLGAVAARRPWRSMARSLLVILAVEHAVLLPWAIRNARAFGRFTAFNQVGGVGLFIGNNPETSGEWYPWPAQLERLRPGTLERGTVAIDDAAREEAFAWIRANPGRAARLYLHKLRIIASDDAFVAAFAIFAEKIPAPIELKPVLPGPSSLKDHPLPVRALLRWSGVLLAVAGLGGLLLLVGRARAGSLPDRALAVGFAAAALYVPMMSAAMHVNGRYRWAAEDALLPLAGLLLSRTSRRRRVETEDRAAYGP